MQFSLYSLIQAIPKFKIRNVSSLRSTGLSFQSLGIRACYNDVAFCFWDLSLYIRNNFICIITRQSLYIQTDRAMNKVKLDNSVNIYKAANALLLFSRNAAERIDWTTNLTVPKRLLFFTRKLSPSWTIQFTKTLDLTLTREFDTPCAVPAKEVYRG